MDFVGSSEWDSNLLNLPHPRELDPGSIIKGGYFAAIGHPSNLWMSLMVGSPLVVASTMLFYQFLNTGMPLNVTSFLRRFDLGMPEFVGLFSTIPSSGFRLNLNALL